MNYSLFLIPYSLFFAFIAWNRFNYALVLFFFLLPTYLIRFNIGPLPTTLLEMMFGIIFLIWLGKHITRNTYHVTRKIVLKNKLLFIGIAIFILSATISIFTSSNLKSALGEWKAFYIEPILMLCILVTSYPANGIPPLQDRFRTIRVTNYLAYSITLVSRITITFISPGYFNSFSISCAMSFANLYAFKSSSFSGLTNTLISLPA